MEIPGASHKPIFDKGACGTILPRYYRMHETSFREPPIHWRHRLRTSEGIQDIREASVRV